MKWTFAAGFLLATTWGGLTQAETPVTSRIDNPFPVEGAFFGDSANQVGDLDGDGVDDLAVGATQVDRVYVLSAADGHLIRTFSTPDVFTDTRFGYAVIGLGDLDGDGCDDLAIGAPYYFGSMPVPCSGFETEVEQCHVMKGQVLVFSGASGSLLYRILAGDYGALRLGHDLAVLGDLDGDGMTDFAAGAPSYENNGFGQVLAFSGRDGFLIWVAHETREQELASFGHFIERLDDLNGDGRSELLVGAEYQDFGCGGRAWVLSGADGSELRSHSDPGAGYPDGFGASGHSLGDQDRDGVDDYAVSHEYTGRLYLYSGRTGRSITVIDGLGTRFRAQPSVGVDDMDGDGAADIWTARRLAPGDWAVRLVNSCGEELLQVDDPGLGIVDASGHFGFRMAAVADADGDGARELLLGKARETVAGLADAGAAYLVTGGSAVEADVFDVSPPRNDFVTTATALDFEFINTAIEHDGLSFDRPADKDFFRVTFPDAYHIVCLGEERLVIRASYPPGCVPTRRSHPPTVTLYDYTVVADDTGGFVMPGWVPVDPVAERLATWTGDSIRVEIPHPRSSPWITPGEAMVFSVASTIGRGYWDLDVHYQCYTPSTVPPPVFDPNMIFMDVLPIQEDHQHERILPTDPLIFMDCLANPACDPAEEAVAVEWLGGDFEMVLEFSSPAEQGGYSARLLDMQGGQMGFAFPAFAGPNDLIKRKADPVPNSSWILPAADLPPGWYVLLVKGPFATRVSYRVGDLDHDGVWTLADSCPMHFSPLQLDSDNDGLGDVCDSCPFDAANDEDLDGQCKSEGDCDDTDKTVMTGGLELCDGLDNDCDTLVDEDVFAGRFLPPLRPGKPKIFKAGRTIPVKLVLEDCQGAFATGRQVQLTLDRFTGLGFETIPVGGLMRQKHRRYVFRLRTRNLSAGTYRIRTQWETGRQDVLLTLR